MRSLLTWFPWFLKKRKARANEETRRYGKQKSNEIIHALGFVEGK